MLSLISGYCFIKSSTVSFSNGMNEKVEPMFRQPAFISLISFIRSIHTSAERRVCFASGRNTSPTSVRPTWWEERSNSVTPNSSSSCLICCESVLCVTFSTREASLKLFVSATLAKYLNCLNSIFLFTIYADRVRKYNRFIARAMNGHYYFR